MATRKTITDIGKSSYIAVSTGFWYEWSLAIPAAFGLDIAKRTATLFDEGETKISLSTWPQVCVPTNLIRNQVTECCKIGRAVAALLSLPIAPDGASKACLQDFDNQVVYVNSFTVSQKGMLESILCVTGGDADDWTIRKESAHEGYASGISEIQEGKRTGWAKMMYTRVFFADGCGDVENSKGTVNTVLGLPKEDIDEATKVAVERSKSSSWVG